MQNKELRFIFNTSFAEIPFFGSVKKGMADAASQLGIQCEFQGPAGYNIPAQAELIEAAVASGCDGLVVNIFDGRGLARSLAMARNAGIPVIAFNVDDSKNPAHRMAGVCQDLFKAGATLGRNVRDRLADGSRVLVLKHDEGVSALDERARGIMSALADKNLRIETIITGNKANTRRIVAELLSANPDITGVFCTGQSDTEGAGTALHEDLRGRACVAAGFDLSVETLRLIQAGALLFAIDQQPYVQGYFPVVQLFQYCRFALAPCDIDAGADVIKADRVPRILELCNSNYR